MEDVCSNPLEAGLNPMAPHVFGDDRNLPAAVRRIARSAGPEEAVRAMEDYLRRYGLPQGAMCRWRRQPPVRPGTPGALALDDEGLPILTGFTVFRPRPGGGQLQRRTLDDGTPIHSIEAAMVALVDLDRQLDGVSVDAARDPRTAVAKRDASAVSPLSPPANPEPAATPHVEAHTTRDGDPLSDEAAPTFLEAELTFGALVERMRSNPAPSSYDRLTIAGLDRLLRRVIKPSNRYDTIDMTGWRVIYKRIGEKPVLTARGALLLDDNGEPQLPTMTYRNGLFGALVKAMDFAVKERSLEHNPIAKFKYAPRSEPRPTHMPTMTEIRRLEHHVMAEAAVAREFVRAGKAPRAAIVPNGREVSRHTRAARVTRRVTVGGAAIDVDVMVSAIGDIALLGPVGGGRRYFASGLEALILTWTHLAPRPGELIALCWDNVNIPERRIIWARSRQGFLREAVQDFTKGGRKGNPKARIAKMPDDVAVALERWRRELDELVAHFGWDLRGDRRVGAELVFPATTGEFLGRSIDFILKESQARAGVPVTKPHQMRHAKESINNLLHVPTAATGEHLGHSARVAEKFYIKAHDLSSDLVDKADAAWRALLDAGMTEEEIVMRLEADAIDDPGEPPPKRPPGRPRKRRTR